MFDILRESLSNLNRNRTRSIIGGLGVTWGILVLIILIGIGNGFKNGILKTFDIYNRNSFWIIGGVVNKTLKQKAYEGTPVTFTEQTLDNLRKQYPQIESISPEIVYSGITIASRDDVQNMLTLKGVSEEYFNIKKITLKSGRLFNRLDLINTTKVILVGQQVVDIFFKNEDCIGKYLTLNGISYKVVGVMESATIINQVDINSVYIPYTSLMSYHTSSPNFNFIGLTLKPNYYDTAFESKISSSLANTYGFELSDKKALYIFNFNKQIEKFQSLFDGIIFFLWFLAGLIIVTGMFNISNLLFLIVKERSKDYAIRKAIGAKPSEILLMVLLESLFITILAGLLGILLGFVVIQLFNWVTFDLLRTTSSVFSQADVDLRTVLLSFLIISFCGVIVGIIPAKKAGEVMPAKALKQE
jgi:putative ABC transport system permease protein